MGYGYDKPKMKSGTGRVNKHLYVCTRCGRNLPKPAISKRTRNILEKNLPRICVYCEGNEVFLKTISDS